MLLAHGSIPELAVRSCIFEKDTYRSYSVDHAISPLSVTQPYERLVNITQKGYSGLVLLGGCREPSLYASQLGLAINNGTISSSI